MATVAGKELLPLLPFAADVFQFTPESWSEIRENILKVEELAFEGKGYSEETLRKDFARPEATVILLRNALGKVIGYSYALPVNIEQPERQKEKDETANIDSTAILPEYQGKKLVGRLIGKLEEELKRKGFKYIEREAAVYNGYADSIQRHYGSRILQTRDQDSEYGPQRFFRIAL